MIKNSLFKTAKELAQVDEKTYTEYKSKSDLLLSKINEVIIERQDLNSLIGSENVDMMKDNHANHLRFMASVFKNFNPEILVDTVLWVFRAYQTHGFSSNYWAAQLNAWIKILEDNLSTESYKHIYPYYEWMQVNIPIFTNISQSDINLHKSKH